MTAIRYRSNRPKKQSRSNRANRPGKALNSMLSATSSNLNAIPKISVDVNS